LRRDWIGALQRLRVSRSTDARSCGFHRVSVEGGRARGCAVSAVTARGEGSAVGWCCSVLRIDDSGAVEGTSDRTGFRAENVLTLRTVCRCRSSTEKRIGAGDSMKRVISRQAIAGVTGVATPAFCRSRWAAGIWSVSGQASLRICRQQGCLAGFVTPDISRR